MEEEEEKKKKKIGYKLQRYISKENLLVKNKRAERTLTRLGGAIARKNIMAETDYRFQKYTALKR
jgi:hypothetical protein